MNFFGSIALFCFNYFLQTVLMDTLLTDTLLCNLTHVVVQYCFQTTYFWMLCEAGFLHRTVVTNVFGHNERVGPFIVLGWGMFKYSIFNAWKQGRSVGLLKIKGFAFFCYSYLQFFLIFIFIIESEQWQRVWIPFKDRVWKVVFFIFSFPRK